MRKHYCLILLVLICSCAGVKPVQDQAAESLVDDIAQSRFGPKYELKENLSGSHVIAYRKYKEIGDLIASLSFFIFEKKSREIVFQDTLEAGKVDWYSDYEIVARFRNKESGKNENGTAFSQYYYDVLKKKKSEGTE